MLLVAAFIFMFAKVFSNSFDYLRKGCIVCYTRHMATFADFEYFYNRSVPESKRNLVLINPQHFHKDVGLSPEVGLSLISETSSNKLGEELRHILSTSDTIIVSDTIPDAIPFILLKLNESANHVYGKLVLQVTNRFDYEIGVHEPDPSFYNLMRKTLSIPSIHWLVNNPWEIAYMTTKNVVLPSNVPLIRPFGFSLLESNEVNPKNSVKCVYQQRSPFDKISFPEYLKSHNITEEHIIPLPEHYGGPKTLAKYKCFVHVPYQVSI